MLLTEIGQLDWAAGLSLPAFAPLSGTAVMPAASLAFAAAAAAAATSALSLKV